MLKISQKYTDIPAGSAPSYLQVTEFQLFKDVILGFQQFTLVLAPLKQLKWNCYSLNWGNVKSHIQEVR